MEAFEFDVLIERFLFQETQTLGTLTVYEDRIKPVYDCKTVELEVDKNEKCDDAIPAGLYTVQKRYSKKYGWHFHIKDVENRSLILIHNAKFSFQLLGCVAVGKKHIDSNKDGLKDITSSKNTMKEILKILPEEFKLKIV